MGEGNFGFWKRGKQFFKYVVNLRDKGIFSGEVPEGGGIPSALENNDIDILYSRVRGRIDEHARSATNWRNVYRARLQLFVWSSFSIVVLYSGFLVTVQSLPSGKSLVVIGLLTLLLSIFNQMYQPGARVAAYDDILRNIEDIRCTYEINYRLCSTVYMRRKEIERAKDEISQIGQRMARLPRPSQIALWQ